MTEVAVNKVTIVLRSLEPAQLDKASSSLLGALGQEGVSSVLSLLRAVDEADGRKLGVAVTIFEELDSIGRRQLMNRLQNLDFTKNVEVSVASA